MCVTLFVHFLYVSLPLFHVCDLKPPVFMCYGGHEHKKNDFLNLDNVQSSPIQFLKN